MDEQNSNTGLWTGLIIAVIAAVVFAALWFLRGGDLDTMRSGMARAESAAASAAGRLERELDTAKSAASAAERRTAELQSRLAEEQRRLTDAGRDAERRIRSELDAANRRLLDANAGYEKADAEAKERAAAVAALESRVAGLTSERARERQLADATAQELARTKESLQQAQENAAGLSARFDKAAADLAAATREAAALREAAEKSAAEAAAAKAAAARPPATPALSAVAQPAVAPEELARVRDELAAARRRAVERETIHRDANDALRVDVETLRKEIAALRARATGDASAEAARLAEAAAAAEKARADLAAQLEAFRKNAAGAERTVSELSGQLRAETARRAEAAAEAESARAALAAAGKIRADLVARAEAARNNAAEAEQIMGELSGQLKAANASRDQLLKQADGLRERLSAARRRLTELEQAEREKKPEPVAATAGKNLPAAAAASANPAPAAAPADIEITLDPKQHLGKIIDFLAGGRSILLDAGANKGMRTGMRLDIHRQTADDIRYVAQIEIIGVQPNGFSTAVLIPDDGPVPVCPVTGRAVRFAEESPFARTSGRAISPVRMDGPAAAGTPAVGDFIDCQL